MAIIADPNGISNVTALQCQACGHEWPEIVELPMELGAFVGRIRAWTACPKCGYKSSARGKQIMLLTDDLYREAVDRFVAEGRVPANINRPWVIAKGGTQ